jgi:hypothetical protein
MPESTPSLKTYGPIVLFGSGETSPSAQKVFDYILRLYSHAPRVGLLETPAGFELNSSRVIGRVADFLTHNLQNYRPITSTIPARSRMSPYSTDDPEVAAPLLRSDVIFMGPGSPSYAVRHLQGSRTWQYLLARHRLGAALVFASAAVVAISQYALPVYEIYKVGEDLHWKPGLDLLGQYGLPLVFIPHWNNNDGGSELDTSRCFMGKQRFAYLMSLLPPGLTVMGIDEKTALILEPAKGEARVIGAGGVTIIHTGHEHEAYLDEKQLAESGLLEVAEHHRSHVHTFQNGENFLLSECCPLEMPVGGNGLPQSVWKLAQDAAQRPEPSGPPAEVLALLERRAAARASKDWSASDLLRNQISALGWSVKDTKDGQTVESL